MRDRAKRLCIPVDQAFASFRRFLDHVGPRLSADYTLDRIDPKGAYAPGNVRWSSKQQQSLNRTNAVLLTYDGQTLPLKAWAAKLGVDPDLLYKRRQAGWTDEEIVLGQRASARKPVPEWPWPAGRALEWESFYQEKGREGEVRELFYYRRWKERLEQVNRRVEPYQEGSVPLPSELADRLESARRHFWDAKAKLERYLAEKQDRHAELFD